MCTVRPRTLLISYLPCRDGISTSAYFRPSSVKTLIRTYTCSFDPNSLSSRFTCLYRITAGAPGASGTPVIFNSSGLMGGQSLPLTFARRFAATTQKIIASKNKTRRLGTRFLRFELDIKLCLVSSKLGRIYLRRVSIRPRYRPSRSAKDRFRRPLRYSFPTIELHRCRYSLRMLKMV